MVQAHELMIGNYIHYNNGNKSVGLISSINKSMIPGNDYVVIDNRIDKRHSLKNIAPIPLTEEWLIKLGVEKHKCGISGADMWQGMDGWSINNPLFSGWLFRGHVGYVKGTYALKLVGYINSRIEYVHQLQNLYFALTGEQLTTKN